MEGWAAGNKCDEQCNYSGALFHYKDGVWHETTTPEVNRNSVLLSVDFPSASEGWAVGYAGNEYDPYTGTFIAKGTIIHYEDDTWGKVTVPQVEGSLWLSSVDFPSVDEGWAVGYSEPSDIRYRRGVLLKYENGAWNEIAAPNVSSSWELWSVDFTSPDEGWAVGCDENGIGVILHYQSGLWSIVTPPPISGWWSLWSVYFTSPTDGWAVGYNNDIALILHYQDGTWTNVSLPPESKAYILTSVFFVSPSEGWAVGEEYGGEILHYQSGEWSVENNPIVDSCLWGLYGVYFPTETEGWAVGMDWVEWKDIILHYYNGEWAQFPEEFIYGTRTDMWLGAVSCTDANNCWFVGRGNGENLVLKY